MFFEDELQSLSFGDGEGVRVASDPAGTPEDAQWLVSELERVVFEAVGASLALVEFEEERLQVYATLRRDLVS